MQIENMELKNPTPPGVRQTKPKSSISRSFLSYLLIAVAAFGLGFTLYKPYQSWAAPTTKFAVAVTSTQVKGVNTAPPSDIAVPADFKQFWELWRDLRDRYYQQPVDEKKMLYGAMTGLAESLGDPYTAYFEPTTAKEFSDSLQGKFEGIGAEIGIKDDQLQVIAPLPDSPAEKAGLKAGDAILKIDKADTMSMSVEKAVSLIRGKKGTTVTLSIGRYKTEKDAKGKDKKVPTIQDVTITRDTISIKSVRVKFLRDGIALIEISSFNQDTSELFDKAVDEVLHKDPKGLILDLRNDPGGYLDRSIAVASAWVGDNIVVKERRQGKIVDQYRGTETARLKNIPTVVLVNGGSASASEIVAGALQDYKAAKILGTKTFGKGSVQDYTEYADKSAVKITIAEWLTPNGRSINKLGIEPDVKIEPNQNDNADRDSQLDKALELLTGKPSPTQNKTGSAAK